MEERLIEAWNIHNRIQIYLLNGISVEGLGDASQGKGRTVADHFAHVHNVRLMWLKASAPELMEGLVKIEKPATHTAHESLKDALTASGIAVEKLEAGSRSSLTLLLRQAIASGGKVKGFKPNVVAFVGYLISHESYHAGKIDLILRQAGHPVDDKTHYGTWEWGVR